MIVFAIILLLCIIPLHLCLSLEPELKIKLRWLGISFPLPAGKKSQGKEPTSQPNWRKLKLFRKIYLESKIKMTAFSLQLAVGTGDAAQTARLAGLLWLLWGAIKPLFPRKAAFAVRPVFGPEPALTGRGFCIFRLVPGYIIIVSAKYVFVNYWKDVVRNAGRRNGKKAASD